MLEQTGNKKDLIWNGNGTKGFVCATKNLSVVDDEKHYTYADLGYLGGFTGSEISDMTKDYSTFYACINPIKEKQAIEIYTPKYNKVFVEAMRKLPERIWNNKAKCWVVSADYKDKAIQIANKCYTSVQNIRIKEDRTHFFRKKANVEAFRYVYVDVDCEKKGLDPDYVAGAIKNTCDENSFPLPSLFKYSGQGIWAFWKIEEVSYTDEDYLNWVRVQEYAYSLLFEYVADPAVVSDSIRVARVGGSVNEKNGKVVYDEICSGYTYTLDELLECVPEDYIFKQEKKAAKKSGKNVKKEYKKRTAPVIDKEHAKELVNKAKEKLDSMRIKPMIRIPALYYEYDLVTKHLLAFCDEEGGFREYHLFIIRNTLRRAGFTEDQAFNVIYAINRLLDHPLSDEEVSIATSSADRYYERYAYSMKHIEEVLGITPEEKTALGKKSLEEIAQAKRQNSSERYYNGLKEQGKDTRDVRLLKDLLNIEYFLEQGYSASEIQAVLGIKRSTFFKRRNYILEGRLNELVAKTGYAVENHVYPAFSMAVNRESTFFCPLIKEACK